MTLPTVEINIPEPVEPEIKITVTPEQLEFLVTVTGRSNDSRGLYGPLVAAYRKLDARRGQAPSAYMGMFHPKTNKEIFVYEVRDIPLPR